MEYILCPCDMDHYATHLLLSDSGDKLTWDSARGQDVLLLQTPYGSLPDLDWLCAHLAGKSLEGQFVDIGEQVWARYVPSIESLRTGGCPLHDRACSYTVLACENNNNNNNNNIFLHAPLPRRLVSPTCDVPIEVHVETVRDTAIQRKLFRRVETDTGFYRVSFTLGDPAGAGYTDGALVLDLSGVTVPVTLQALQQRTVYIKTQTPPVLRSTHPGVRLI